MPYSQTAAASLRPIAALATLMLSVGSLLAQKPSAAQELLPAESQTFVRTADASLHFSQRSVPGGRIDNDTGVWRAMYRIKATGPALDSPESTARAWMAMRSDEFGWTLTDDLVLIDEVRTPYNAHLTFRQTFRGLPVHRRTVKVNLGPDGLPTMVFSSYAPHLSTVSAFDVTPAVTQDEARQRAEQLVSEEAVAESSTPLLVVYPASEPLLAWRIVAWPEGAPGEWEVLLNAHTGAVIHLLDLVMRHRPDPPRRVDGKGKVWIPDPITSAGVSYGGSYVDNDDADSDALNGERKDVILLDIERGSDGKYRLKGPHVTIDGSVGPSSYSPPAEDSADGFNYLRANQHFEAVQVYYHIDFSQRYIQSLDIGRSIQGSGLRANPHGEGSADNSVYYPFSNAVSFGDGGIDDGEDAEVIWHEYGHAIVEASSSSLFDRKEGGALHEGFSDYWAVSYTRGLMEDGIVPAHDWRHVFSWDGNETWAGRRLGSTANYPEGFECTGSSPFCNFYSDGLIWATTLMKIYDEIGKEKIDRLNLISHGYLTAPVKLSDAAEALLQADRDTYQGAHQAVIGDILVNQGYVDCISDDAQLLHTPVTDIPDAAVPLDLELTITTCTDPVVRHDVQYSVEDGTWITVPMTAAGGNRYVASIDLSPETKRVDYFFEIEQAGGTVTSLPAAAPAEVFSAAVGTDTEAPVIEHAYLTHVATGDWPPVVEATITDAVGIDSAWVEFDVVEPGHAPQPMQTFGLTGTGTVRVGSFPAMDLPLKSLVRYRLRARDRSAANNEAVLPPPDQPPFVIHIIEAGILASYDADEGAVLDAAGEWRRVVPNYGVRIAHSGEYIWATTAGEAYTAQASTSVLTIPEIDLINFSEAYLELWHWHDFEHIDIADPTGAAGGIALDGGNIKVSTDGGVVWQLLEPERGYTAELDSGNPLAGEQGYAGYSYGWRRALFSLPHVSSLHLRIEFGTGSGNSYATAHGFAGWVVDDIRILERRPADNTEPAVIAAPLPLVSVPAGQSAPRVHVQASDDTGIESVVADFTFETGSAPSRSGTMRLAMDTTGLTSFHGAFPVPGALERGDRIRYRIRVRDFDDNALQLPAQDKDPFVIEARLVELRSALAQATVTGHWGVHGSGGFATTNSSDAPVSSIVLAPADLPSNASSITLQLDHAVAFKAARGNIKVSTNEGAEWPVLEPMGGYDEVFRPGDLHPMGGQQVFAADRDEVTYLDLTQFAGNRVWMRIDLGTNGSLGSDESWIVRSAVLESSTVDESLKRDPGLALHSNFPDPFTGRTTLSYSLPETMPVLMEVHNVLGQRVRVLLDREQAAGTHTLHLDLSNLAGGVYFVRLRAGRQTFLEPLVLAH